MGLFSIFNKGKKDDQPGGGLEGLPESRLRGEPSRSGYEIEAERARQREISRATAMKIDAIEEEMVSNMFEGEPAWGRDRRRRRAAPAAKPAAPVQLEATQLIDIGEAPDAVVEAQSAPLIEEVAIMWANGESELARHMLVDGLGTDRVVWWLLFDLYQATSNQVAFDDLAIDYASRFETSPPTWKPAAQGGKRAGFAGVTPNEVFTGVLNTGAAPQLKRILSAAESRPRVRVEFDRIDDVETAGCALLLSALRNLRKRPCELILSGAPHLAQLLRSTLEVGKRGAGEAPWLLLLELQQLMNLEKEFEETAMDYCITFEVSPPSFVPPARVETTSASPTAAARSTAVDRFTLPATIRGVPAPHALLDEVDMYCSQYDPAVLDCSQMIRCDFEAAGLLLNRLRPLAEKRKIELRDMNHLVAALFRLIGFSDVARIFPHKY